MVIRVVQAAFRMNDGSHHARQGVDGRWTKVRFQAVLRLSRCFQAVTNTNGKRKIAANSPVVLRIELIQIPMRQIVRKQRCESR